MISERPMNWIVTNNKDTNGCTATHIMVVYDNIKMFDMAVECGAAINMTNRLGLTPLTMAAYLARMDMFFHIASIERDIYWQLGNITCSAYPLRSPILLSILTSSQLSRYLDTIDSDTGDLNTISALNLIVFGPKLEHLDLIEYVVVDLLKVKWETFIKREFFKQMTQFTIFFCLAITAFIIRPPTPEPECKQENNSTELIGNETVSSWTTDLMDPALVLMSNGTNATCELVSQTKFTNCYLHSMETTEEYIRLGCEVSIVFLAILYILKALRELSFLGRKVFMENMKLCPSRVCFLFSCLLLQFCIPARIFCLYIIEDSIIQLCMLSNGLYFLFFCRGFKLVGPMVIMIYRMLAQDLMRFGIIYSMFIIGFSQAYYIIFQSFEVRLLKQCTLPLPLIMQESEEEGNPLRNPTESFIQVDLNKHISITFFKISF